MSIAFDPLAPGFVESPYEQYAALRAADPVHRSELLSGWVLTRYADVDRVLRDGDVSVEPTSAAGNPVIDAEIERMERGGRSAATLVLRDDPDHARLRRLMQAPFGPRAVERMRDTVAARVAEALDSAIGSHGAGARTGQIDVVADFAYPLPVALFCELLGVPAEDSPKFRTWTRSVAQNLDPFLTSEEREANLALYDEMDGYLSDLVEAKREQPGDDVMSALVAAEEDGQRLTREELVAQVVTLYVAGHEPVTALVGNGLLALVRHPDQLSRLRADPSLLPHAILELLRFDGPNQFVRRIATQPIEFDEATIEPGEVIYPGVGAANRDPARWGDDAESVRIDRPDAGSHLQFGAGIHNCLGAHLARLQAEAMLGALLRRLTDIELAGDVEWSPRMVLRSVDRLPITYRTR
jgi:cytochrome P450